MCNTDKGANHVNDLFLWDIRGVILIVQQKVVCKIKCNSHKVHHTGDKRWNFFSMTPRQGIRIIMEVSQLSEIQRGAYT
jgi:hypothetical protein